VTVRTRVKICGLTRFEDAELAVQLGADALGFVFWPGSPRAVGPDAVRDIVRHLPPLPVRVGVFVNAPPSEVARVAEMAALDVVQLHGEENVDDYMHLAPRLIKAVHVSTPAALDSASRLPSAVVLLVDAVDPARRGGTGQVSDWTSAARLSTRRPVILAGGLTEENVGQAVLHVRPWAVDVSSGVEWKPGLKSPDRMRAFFMRVHEANAEGE
jgi:phosphoribosylanthranilate isomerase